MSSPHPGTQTNSQSNSSQQLPTTQATGSAATQPSVITTQGNTQAVGSMNCVTLCRMGQDTVQEIVSKTNELFQILKNTQLPNDSAAAPQVFSDKKAKLEELSKHVVNRFKTLHFIYDKVNEYTASLDLTTQVPSVSDTYPQTAEEHREVMQQVKIRNSQLKDIIDHLRTVIWEINTMIAMRKTLTT